MIKKTEEPPKHSEAESATEKPCSSQSEMALPDPGRTGETVTSLQREEAEMATRTSTRSYDNTYKEAIFELLKKNWDFKNDKCANSDFVDRETDRLRAEAALRAKAKEEKEAWAAKKIKEDPMDNSKFYRMIMSPTIWDSVNEEFESLQNSIEYNDFFDLYGKHHEISYLAGYIDLLLKMFTLMQHMKNLTGKGMESDKQ